MKPLHARLAVALALLVRTAAALPADDRDLQEQARKSLELADRTRAVLAQALEQNERLREDLEQTRRELLSLNEEVSRLRSSFAELQAAGKISTSARPEDLSTRLARMDDRIEVNTAQIREQAQTKIESDSRFHVRLFGSVLYNTFYNSRDSGDEAVPFEAPASSAQDLGGRHNFGATLRQTSLGFALTGPRVGDARLSASADFDFYGGTPGTYGTDVLGVFRLRTAYARLDGRNDSIAMGLMEPLISPLNPASLAAVAYPALGESGNLWQWVPQTTAEHRIAAGESGTVVLQGGLMLPTGDNFYGRRLQGRPGYEARAAFVRKLDPERRVQFGLGAYLHPQNFGFGRKVNSYAATTDWVIPLDKRLEIRGEAYYGQSITLGASSGPDISGLFGFSGRLDDPASRFWGVQSAGGWLQLHTQATTRLEFNAAYGSDDPRNRDIAAGTYRDSARLRNRTFSLNSIYQLRSNFTLALEYRRLSTEYPDGRRSNDHVNFAVGYLF